MDLLSWYKDGMGPYTLILINGVTAENTWGNWVCNPKLVGPHFVGFSPRANGRPIQAVIKKWYASRFKTLQIPWVLGGQLGRTPVGVGEKTTFYLAKMGGGVIQEPPFQPDLNGGNWR